MGRVNELLVPIHNFLDTLEPQHMRRGLEPNSRMMFLTYGFGALRWGEAIICLDPSLKLNVELAQAIYGFLLGDILTVSDTKEPYQDKFEAAIWLNIVHEALYLLKSSPTVNESTTNHFLSVIEDRISHIYCMLLPAAPKRKKDRRKLTARVFVTYSRTSKLMPQEYKNCRPVVHDAFVLRSQRSLEYKRTSQGKIVYLAMLKQLSKTTTHTFPGLFRFVPEPFLAIFGFGFDYFSQRKEEYSREELEFYELMESALMKFRPKAIQLLIALSAHAFSVISQTILDTINASEWCPTKVGIMDNIIMFSFDLCENFLYDHRHQRVQEIMMWIKRLHFSVAMSTWIENVGYLQKVKKLFMD